MSHDPALQLIDRQEWLEPVGEEIQKAVSAAFESTGEPGQKVKNFLHGTWLGHPLHPVLTDIPLGAWTTALASDAMAEITGRDEFEKCADTAIGVGLVGSVAAAVTGLTDWKETDGRARNVGLAHGLLNSAGALLYLTSFVLRKRRQRSIARGFSTLGFAVAATAAYLGGKLVYSERIGVNHATGELPRTFSAVLPVSELTEEKSKSVTVNGTSILLTRRNSSIYAMVETCSHLGGPLAKGKFDECSVTCPWHGSQFSLEDGKVINGPATHPQPCLEVRVRKGMIEVRAAKEDREG